MTSEPPDRVDATPPALGETSGDRPPAPRRRRHRLWLWALLGLGAAPILLLCSAGVYVVRCLHLTSTTDDLKTAVVRHSGGGWRLQFAGNIGWLPLTAARFGLHFAKGAPPEAALALRAVRSGEAAVYQRTRPGKPANFKALLAAADKVMARAGWERAVGVIDGGECVGVYVPSGMKSTKWARATVFVVSGDDLVVASATADLRPLAELVRQKLAENGRAPALAFLR